MFCRLINFELQQFRVKFTKLKSIESEKTENHRINYEFELSCIELTSLNGPQKIILSGKAHERSLIF